VAWVFLDEVEDEGEDEDEGRGMQSGGWRRKEKWLAIQ
jgi:hypothetical protein